MSILTKKLIDVVRLLATWPRLRRAAKVRPRRAALAVPRAVVLVSPKIILGDHKGVFKQQLYTNLKAKFEF